MQLAYLGVEGSECGGGSAERRALFGPQQREELATCGGTVRDERPAGARAALLTLDLREPVARQGAALRLRLHSVETRRVEPEDQALRPLGEGRVPELLLHRFGDRERLEGVDEPLRRSPPDGVGAPEDVARPESLQELAHEVRGGVRSLWQDEGERRSDLGGGPVAFLLGNARQHLEPFRQADLSLRMIVSRGEVGRVVRAEAELWPVVDGLREVGRAHRLLASGREQRGSPLCTFTRRKPTRSTSCSMG